MHGLPVLLLLRAYIYRCPVALNIGSSLLVCVLARLIRVSLFLPMNEASLYIVAKVIQRN